MIPSMVKVWAPAADTSDKALCLDKEVTIEPTILMRLSGILKNKLEQSAGCNGTNTPELQINGVAHYKLKSLKVNTLSIL
jgi:hypothetical protein